MWVHDLAGVQDLNARAAVELTHEGLRGQSRVRLERESETVFCRKGEGGREKRRIQRDGDSTIGMEGSSKHAVSFEDEIITPSCPSQRMPGEGGRG